MISDEKFTASRELMEQAYNYLRDGYEQALNALEEAETENAKLHELVRDVWHLFTEHGAVNPCDLPVVDAVRDRMRELGIEVDE